MSVLGGGYAEYFLGHVVLIHKADGNSIGGVLELPGGWDQPGFEWPHGPRSMDEPARVYVGTHSAKETEQLGIDRKSTRLNSSHRCISYAVFCLKKKKKKR